MARPLSLNGMNDYQRRLLDVEADNLTFDDCKDCNQERGNLPEEMLDAAKKGDVGLIQKYLGKPDAVNDLCNGECLLSRACDAGQNKVVELLLKQPHIHLNQRYEGSTPIVRAAQNGHTECVRLLLDTECKCRPQLTYSWTGIINVLKEKPELKQQSMIYVLGYAAREAEWDAVELLLQTDYYIPERRLSLVFMHAINCNRWDIVNEILKRKFSGKDEFLNEILVIFVQLRCWLRVKEVLEMMNKELKLEVPLAQAALDGDVDQVQRLLQEQEYDAQTLNGCLLVVAAGGTNEPTVQLLMNIKNTYTRRTFSDALYLAAVGEHSALVLPLICNPESFYSFHDFYRAHKIASLSRWGEECNILVNILDKAMDHKVQELF